MAEALATTVAIPLHRGLPWVDSVVGNIARLRGHARLIVSDVHEHDGALEEVRRRVDAGPDLILVGRRDLAAGWVAHCNDLLARATTPLFMWLPQDDEIDAGWIARCEAALGAHPAAVLAHGVLVGVDAEGLQHRGEVIAPSGHLADPALDGRLHAAGRFLVDAPAPLGIAFRGVFRREWACPLPAGDADGEWGDLLWALAMLLRGPFVEAPGAAYRKRYRPDGEHTWWTPTARPPGLVPAVLRALVDAGPAEHLPAALAALWAGDREARIASLDWAEECAAVAGRSLEETHRAAGEV
ncbi:MAG: glycosyltransferase family A protein, partial [Miltoncostaeaceae bacterium]